MARRFKRQSSYKTVADLIRGECANWMRGGCILQWKCPATNPLHRCIWLEEAVLPEYPELEEKYWQQLGLAEESPQ